MNWKEILFHFYSKNFSLKYISKQNKNFKGRNQGKHKKYVHTYLNYVLIINKNVFAKTQKFKKKHKSPEQHNKCGSTIQYTGCA